MFGFEFSDEGVPPPDRSEAEEMEEWYAEDSSDPTDNDDWVKADEDDWDDSVHWDS